MFFLKFKALYGLLALAASSVVGVGYWADQKVSNMSDEEISTKIKGYTNLDVKFDNRKVNWRGLSIDLELNNADIKFADDLDIEKGTIDSAVFSFNIPKSIINLEPTLEKISINRPKIFIPENTEADSDNQTTIPIFDQSGMVKVFQQSSDLREVDILNAELVKRNGQGDTPLLKDANVKIVNIPGTSSDSNRIIKLDIDTKIEPTILSDNIITKNLKPVDVTVTSRTEYLQDQPVSTSIHAAIKDINYNNQDGLHIHADEIGADINWDQDRNKQELEFSSIYILKDSKKLDLNDLKVKSDIRGSNLHLDLTGEQLPVHILLPFLDLRSEDILVSGHSINLSNTILSDLEFNAKFSGFSLEDTKLNMKIANVEADDLKNEIKYKITNANLNIDNNEYNIELFDNLVYLPSYICKRTVEANSISGKFKIVYAKDKTKLDVNEMKSRVCGFQLTSKGNLDFETKKSPYINITGDFSHEDMSIALQDITSKYISASLLKWLRSSLPSQNKLMGDYKFQGYLDKAPFEKNEGLLQVNANMYNITFDFDPKWERLRHTDVDFKYINNLYKIKVSKGFLDEAELAEATTEFSASERLDDIIVRLRLNTKIQSIIKYLLKSPLRADVPNQKHFYLSGNSIVDLKLRVPLEDYILSELDGNARIENGAVDNNKTKIRLANNIVSTVEIKRGDLSVQKYTPDGDKNMYVKIQGVSKLNMRKPRDSKKSYIKYNSNFDIDYTRESDDVWKWLINANFDNQRHDISGIEQGRLVSFSSFRIGGEYSNKKSSFKLLGKNGLFGSYLNDLKVDKDKIKIVFKKCNLFYLSLYNHIMKSLALDTSDSLSSKKIRIELEDLDIYSNMFDRLNIDAHFENGNTIFDLKDKANRGKMVYYPKNDVWMMDLKKVTFKRNSEELSFDSFMYEHHANFKAKIEEMNVNGKDLGEFEVIYNPRLNPNIDKMDDSLLDELKTDDPKTNLAINVYSKNFENFLKEFEFDSKILAQTGEVQVTAKWSINKPVIKFKDLQGNIEMDLSDGRLNLGTGVGASKYFGRIISILNVATLPRRLTLDFKDVTASDSDLVFDNVTGHVALRAGHYSSEDLNISTTSAKLNIDGELDYNRKNADFVLSVMPRLTGGIPIVAAVAGGPVVGLAALAANSLIGDNINKLSIKKYKVSGELDDLKIEEIKSKKKKE